MPSHHSRILTLQRSVGNAAVTQALTVQRDRSGWQSANDGYDSDLAYGPSPGPAERSFTGVVGRVHFSAENNGQLMRELSQFIAGVSPYFQDELTAAGAVTVRFGRTQGGGVGEWRSDSRTVMLNPSHRAVRRVSTSRLFGAAVFEILNASAEDRRAELDEQVIDGRIDRSAAQAGLSPAQYYGREVEYIEWKNTLVHRNIMAAAGRLGTNADLFSAESGEFEPYYQRQLGSHTHSYEFRYSYLRAQARF